MSTERLGLFARIGLALKVLFSGVFAAAASRAAIGDAAIDSAAAPAALPEPDTLPVSEAPPPAEAAAEVPADHRPGALRMLALLQREGRFVDFLSEDVASFSDEEVGAAARAVHEGCAKVVQHYLTLVPVRSEPEGGPISVDAGFDPAEIRLTGSVAGDPPYLGILAHPGWRVSEVKLPEVQSDLDPYILYPAEVEL